MNEIDIIKQIARQKAQEYPALASEIMESARLSLSEIAEGGSPAHELELFEDHIEQLIT